MEQMTQISPARYELRLEETASGDGAPYYVVKEWRESCDCPDCEKDGHWIQIAGSPDKQSMLSLKAKRE